MAGTKNYLLAIDGKTGNILWSKKDVVISKDHVWPVEGTDIVLISDPDKKLGGIVENASLYALELMSGNVIWSTPDINGRPLDVIPLLDKLSILYITDQKYLKPETLSQSPMLILHMYNIDIHSGNIRWEKDFNKEVLGTKVEDTWLGYKIYNLSGYHRPVLRGSELYLLYDGITKMDFETGNILWQTTYPAGDPELIKTDADPIFTEKIIYTSGKGQVKGINRETGELLWDTENLGLVPTLLVEEKTIEVIEINDKILENMKNTITEDKFIILMNLKNATYSNEEFIQILKASNFTDEEINSLMITRNTGIIWAQRGGFFYNANNNKWISKGPFGVTAIDLENGRLIWDYRLGEGSLANILLLDDRVILGDKSCIIALNKYTGDKLYHRDLGIDSPMFAFRNSDGKVVFSSSMRIAAFDPQQGDKIWESGVKKPVSAATTLPFRLSAGIFITVLTGGIGLFIFNSYVLVHEYIIQGESAIHARVRAYQKSEQYYWQTVKQYRNTAGLREAESIRSYRLTLMESRKAHDPYVYLEGQLEDRKDFTGLVGINTKNGNIDKGVYLGDVGEIYRIDHVEEALFLFDSDRISCFNLIPE